MNQGSAQGPEGDSFVYRTQADRDGAPALSTTVLEALDAAPEFDVEDGDTVVFDHVDPDALDDLFSPVSGGNRNGQVQFTVDQYEVTATAAGEVTIRNRSVAADD